MAVFFNQATLTYTGGTFSTVAGQITVPAKNAFGAKCAKGVSVIC